MRSILLVLFSFSITLTQPGCQSSSNFEFKSVFNKEEQTRSYSPDTKNRQANRIADALLKETVDTRSLRFTLSGDAAIRNSDVVADFVSRMSSKTGRIQARDAEFRIHSTSTQTVVKREPKARHLSMKVEVIAVRTVAAGSQTLMSAKGQGDCSRLLLWLPRCEKLESALLEQLLYELR